MRDASLPSVGSRQARFPDVASTMKALRLPAPHPRSLIGFARGYHVYLRLRARRSAPMWPEASHGPGPLFSRWSAPARVAWTIRDLPGSLTILPVPLPSSRTPVGSTPLANHGVSMLPPRRRPRRLQRLELFRGVPLGFSTCCLRFKSPLAGTQARLASGWPALSLYRAAVEPAGPLRKVSGHLHGLPPFQGFPWRDFDRLRMTRGA